MKKFAILFALIFVCACGGGGSGGSGGDDGGDNGGGDGAITTEVALLAIDCAKDYSLGGNISITSAWQGLCPNGYTGTFDGDGYTITFSGTFYRGLFAQIGNNGEVKNLKIKASNGITGGAVDVGFEHNVAGAVAGFANANSTIDNCTVHITGGITAGDAAGGLAGYSGIISNSAAVVGGDIEAKNAGGLSGYASGTISNSFAVISNDIKAPTASGNAGGLAGNARAAISNSAALINGDINGNVSGNIWGESNVSTRNNNYIFGGIAPYNDSDSQSGKSVSAADLKTSAWWGTGTDKLGLVSDNWDFANIASNMPLQEALSGKADPIAWPAWLIDSRPTKIASADGLKLLNNACDKDFVLKKDITVTEAWTGPCASTTGYTGTLDGGGFGITFSGNVNGGFFAVIGAGTVKNLKININGGITPTGLSTITETLPHDVAGALAAEAKGGTIDNITVSFAQGVSFNTDKFYIGGMIGYDNATSIKNSKVTINGDYTAQTDWEHFLGGIAGYAINGSLIDNSSVIIRGSITAKSGSGGAGGIAGSARNSSIIKNSFAIINGDIESASAGGGLVGSHLHVTSIIENCFAIVGGGINDHYYAGGVAGSSFGTIKNSFAVVRDNITTSGTNSGYRGAGGIVGNNASTDSTASLVKNSFSIVGDSIKSQQPVGGIAGATISGGTISDSIAIVQNDITFAGGSSGAHNIWGTGSGSGTNNYRYKDNVNASTNNHNDWNGKSVTVAELKGTTWWTNTTLGSGGGFTPAEWSITNNSYVPIPIALKDKAEAIDWTMFSTTWNDWNDDKNPLKWPDWVQ